MSEEEAQAYVFSVIYFKEWHKKSFDKIELLEQKIGRYLVAVGTEINQEDLRDIVKSLEEY